MSNPEAAAPQPDVRQALPHASASEREVLSAMMSLDPQGVLAMQCFDRLVPEAFHLPLHQTLARWIQSQIARGQPVDMVTLVSETGTNKDLGDLFRKTTDNIALAVADIYGACGSAAHFVWHVNKIADCYQRRQAIRACVESINEMYEGANPVGELLVAVQERISAINHDFTEVRSEKDVALAALADIERNMTSDTPMGYATGFAALDSSMSVRPGTLITLAARTSVGKTALGMQLADNLSNIGLPTLVFTKEMSSEQLMTRLLSQDAGVNVETLTKTDTAEHQRLMQYAARRAARDKMSFRDVGKVNLTVLETMIRTFAMRGLKVALIDYLQLIGPTKRAEKLDRRHQIAEITGGLKALAKELGITVILISQINRIKPDQRPTLVDLSESKTIEEDSDQVLLLFRKLGSSSAEIQIAKDRYGETTGWLEIGFTASLTQFRDKDA